MTTALASLTGLVARVEQTKSKEAFHRAGQALLKGVAREIGHPTARVYSSRGGPAVLGEVGIQCLGAGFWGQICRAPNMAPPWSRETAKGALAFLHRKASSADPLGTGVGSPNHWAPLDKLADENFLAFLARGLVPVDASCDPRLGLPGFPVRDAAGALVTCGLCAGAPGVTAHAPGCGGEI